MILKDVIKFEIPLGSSILDVQKIDDTSWDLCVFCDNGYHEPGTIIDNDYFKKRLENGDISLAYVHRFESLDHMEAFAAGIIRICESYKEKENASRNT